MALARGAVTVTLHAIDDLLMVCRLGSHRRFVRLLVTDSLLMQCLDLSIALLKMQSNDVRQSRHSVNNTPRFKSKLRGLGVIQVGRAPCSANMKPPTCTNPLALSI